MLNEKIGDEDRGVKVTVDARRVKVHMESLLAPFKVHKKHAICAGHDGIGGDTNHTLSMMNRTSAVVQVREQATTQLPVLACTFFCFLNLHSFNLFGHLGATQQSVTVEILATYKSCTHRIYNISLSTPPVLSPLLKVNQL